MGRSALLLVFVVLTTLRLAAQSESPRFEVASIKPTTTTTISRNPIPRAQPGGRFTASLTSVESLLWFAYDLPQYRIVGGPDWVREDWFEINAKAETDASADRIKLMVRSLLKDRFKLVTHSEPRDMSVLALVRARPNGPLGPSLVGIDECSPPVVNDLRRKFPEKYPSPIGGGMVSGCSSKGLGDLAVLLTTGQDTPVIDASGLKGSFYFTIRSQFIPFAATSRIQPDPNLPALSTALQEQLGLKLESRRGPVEVLVIDSVERPTPD